MDSTAPGNQILHYWVRGTNAAGEGALSDPDSGYFLNSPPLAPLDFSASDNTAIDRVLLSWSASEFASAYRIFRSSGNTPESAVEIGATSSTTFDDLSAVSGENYFYWVKAENVVGEGAFGESAAGSLSIATPDLLIGKTAAVKIGDDLFSDTGLNQRVRQISKKGRKLVYFFGIENNGSVSDTFNLTGTSGSSLFRALYRDRTGANVNASILTGSFRTALEADEQTSLNLEIAPGKGAVGKRKQRIFVIRIVSTEDPLKLDSNQAVAESR